MNITHRVCKCNSLVTLDTFQCGSCGHILSIEDSIICAIPVDSKTHDYVLVDNENTVKFRFKGDQSFNVDNKDYLHIPSRQDLRIYKISPKVSDDQFKSIMTNPY